MRTLSQMTKDERSLLLYFEAMAVDQWGRVDTLWMNEDDFEIATRWDEEGFIEFGRIIHKDCIVEHNKSFTHYVFLSPECINLAQEERRARISRVLKKRTFTTTKEKRGESHLFSQYEVPHDPD